jgi:hypothetical protein
MSKWSCGCSRPSNRLPRPGTYAMRDNALRHARLALVRAENALKIPEDLTAVREAARFAV